METYNNKWIRLSVIVSKGRYFVSVGNGPIALIL